MIDRPEDPGTPGDAPPTAPPAAPEAVPLESETSVRSGGIGARVAAGALGVALLLGGVAFAATQAGSDGGADDPTAAVEDMFDAIADEDVLGLLATLDAGERDVLSDPLEDLFDELERLDVLDDSFDLGGIDGIDLEFDELTFREEPVRDDLVRVYLTGGTASFAVDTDDIPVGDFLADTFDRFGIEYRGVQESGSEALDPSEADDTFVVARRSDDGWRISLGYTAVEVVRLRSGAPVPAAGDGLAAVGADTPEGAVEGFLRAAAAIDVEGAVARLSPAELGAVHAYWPALVGDAELPTSDDVRADIELTDLVLRSTTDGDRGTVFVDSIGVDVVTDDFEGGATVADGCIEVRGDVRSTLAEEDIDLPDGPICQDDVEEILEELSGGAGMGLGGLGGLGTLGASGGEAPDVGITVVRIDGTWFVAPFGTFADVGLALLETVDREDLEAAVDAIEGFFGGGFFGGGDVSSGFVPPGMEEGDWEEWDDFEELDEIGGSIGEAPDALGLDAALEELVLTFTLDPAVGACTVEQLNLKADTQVLYELVDAHQFQYEPSFEAQDALFAALSACGG